jgi:hypothetical protein
VGRGEGDGGSGAFPGQEGQATGPKRMLIAESCNWLIVHQIGGNENSPIWSVLNSLTGIKYLDLESKPIGTARPPKAIRPQDSDSKAARNP